MIIKGEFVEAYSVLPIGDFYGRYNNRRYIATRTESEDGKRGWIYAHEMGGNDFISFNFYRLSNSNRLKPCEMPAEKVISFILGLEVEKGVRVNRQTTPLIIK